MDRIKLQMPEGTPLRPVAALVRLSPNRGGDRIEVRRKDVDELRIEVFRPLRLDMVERNFCAESLIVINDRNPESHNYIPCVREESRSADVRYRKQATGGKR